MYFLTISYNMNQVSIVVFMTETDSGSNCFRKLAKMSCLILIDKLDLQMEVG